MALCWGLGPCWPRGVFTRVPWELAGGPVLSSRLREAEPGRVNAALLGAPKLAGHGGSEYGMSCLGVSGPQGEHPRSSTLVLLSGAAVTGGGRVG